MLQDWNILGVVIFFLHEVIFFCGLNKIYSQFRTKYTRGSAEIVARQIGFLNSMANFVVETGFVCVESRSGCF